MASLIITSGEQAGEYYQLDERTLSAGRDPARDIYLRDAKVSRQHFEICKRDNDYEITEMKSRNGVYVNNVEIGSGHLLRDGDHIQVGETHLVFYATDEQDRTNVLLLSRVKDWGDREAWEEFHGLYAPLLYRFARSRGISHADAEEVRDQCLELLTRKMETFEYSRSKGRFKNLLYKIAADKVRELLRKPHKRVAESEELQMEQDPASSPELHWDKLWEIEHIKFCVEKVKSSVSEKNYQAFCLLYFDNCSVEEVAERLDMNANHVYQAKSRMLQRVRRMLASLDPTSQC